MRKWLRNHVSEIAVGLIVGFILFAVCELGLEYHKNHIKPEFTVTPQRPQTVPQPKAEPMAKAKRLQKPPGSPNINFNNQGPRVFRGVTATFKVLPPPMREYSGAGVDVTNIVFHREDFDRRTNTYTLPIDMLKLPPNDVGTIRVYIVRPRQAGEKVFGHLKLEFSEGLIFEHDMFIVISGEDP